MILSGLEDALPLARFCATFASLILRGLKCEKNSDDGMTDLDEDVSRALCAAG